MPFFSNSGHCLFYREVATGPLLLLLPGNTASSACHDGEMQYFGQRFHVVSLDFWGTGQSDRNEVWPDDWWQQGAHDAAALIRYLGYRQGFVMGTSGGAIVALLVAILHPMQARAVIADSTVEYFRAPALSQEIRERSQNTDEKVGFWQWAHGEDWEQVVKADSDFLLRFEQAGGDCFQGRLKEIQCPVMLSASLGDSSLPNGEAQLRGMAKQLNNCRLSLAQEGTHPLMWTRAEEFRRKVDEFLFRIGTGEHD